MNTTFENTAKSSQEQAVASWINYLNQIRLDGLMQALNSIRETEKNNLNKAVSTINDTLDTISKEIINNGNGRGGTKGMHGFIAEVSEVGIENARNIIEGKAPVCEWIDDNGPSDIKIGSEYIQQKFYKDHLSLRAISKHLDKYPDYIKNGAKYQIPRDQYQKIQELLSISKDEAYKRATSTGDFSFDQWKEVHDFFATGEVPFESIKPASFDYRSAQVGRYEDNLDNEIKRLKDRNRERICEEKTEAYQNSKPSLGEAAKSTAIAAVAEGGMVFSLEIVKRRKEGKKFRDFTEKDWAQIAEKTGKGTLKGGVRGISIYALSNYTATPTAVVNAMVTASFGVAEQAHLYREGKLDETDFLINSEIVCMDSAVSAVSALIGQMIIPAPVIGAVVGNAVGTFLYQIAKDNLSEKEQQLINQYIIDIEKLDAELEEKYRVFLEGLSSDLQKFIDILDRAFAPDVRIGFSGSIELAGKLGVPSEEILSTKEMIYSYFVD